MADAILVSGGVGGVTSDDVTARREHVLQGYTALTSDSNDEPVQGTIPHRSTWSTASEVVNASGENTVHVRFEEGYYSKDRQYKPTAKIPYAVLSNVLGIDANKMLQTLIIAGKQGQIKTVKTSDDNYNINKSVNYGIDGFGRLYMDLPHGNAYYCRDDGHPHTCIDAYRLGDTTADKVLAGSTFTSKNGLAVQGTMPNRGNGMKAVDFYNAHWESNFVARMEPGYYSMVGEWKPYVTIPYAVLAQAAGVDASKMLQGYSTAGVQGAIPRWVSNSHVVSALNGEGFVWDDDTGENRGRGIVSKIPKGHYIQSADWVFLPSPNLYPQNVVKDVNINGTIGTRDFVDKVNEYAFATNVEISMQNRNQSISLGNAYANSETVFFGVETVGEDVWDGFVRRDKGNGRYLIGRIPVSKNDSNLLGTFIRNTPVQIEISRDGAGNINLIHHGPNQVLGATKLNVYIYAHSSISFRF